MALTLIKSTPFIQKSKGYPPARIEDLLGQYKSSARARRDDWTISDDLARHILRSACSYCEMPANPELNGIERLDSETGYVEGNVVACCKFCARAKGVFSTEEFRGWIKNLRDHWKKAIYVHQKRGRPRKMKDCPHCDERMTARELWLHKCKRPKIATKRA